MKKIISLLLVVLTALCLCGCQNITKEDVDHAISQAEEAIDTAKEVVEEVKEEVGKWMLAEEIEASEIDKDVLDIFNKALEGYAGQGFEPIALLGTQVVSGTNYMFLCKATSVTANPEVTLKVVTIYNDTDGNAEILHVADFDMADYILDRSLTVDELVGGWTVNADAKELEAEPLKKATEGLTGASYKALALLGTQAVAGKNYCYLAVKTIVTANPISTMCILNVYEDTKGGYTLISVCDIDLAEYNK